MTSPSPILPFDCPLCGSTCKVGYGYCHCGCGEKAPLSDRTITAKWQVKGVPLYYIRFHRKTPPTPSTEVAAPFKIDGVYCRLIPLTKGQFTIVWESDYEWLSQRSWCADWCKTSHGYYAKCGIRSADGKNHHTSMHRMILELDWDDERVADHIEAGNTLDNRRSNLRITDRLGNARNRRISAANTSGYKGVHPSPRDEGVYIATIRRNGVPVYLGCSRDPYKAHLLYVEAAKKEYGEFARMK